MKPKRPREEEKKWLRTFFISSFRKLKWQEHYQRSICDRSEMKKDTNKNPQGSANIDWNTSSCRIENMDLLLGSPKVSKKP